MRVENYFNSRRIASTWYTKFYVFTALDIKSFCLLSSHLMVVVYFYVVMRQKKSVYNKQKNDNNGSWTWALSGEGGSKKKQSKLFRRLTQKNDKRWKNLQLWCKGSWLTKQTKLLVLNAGCYLVFLKSGGVRTKFCCSFLFTR